MRSLDLISSERVLHSGSSVRASVVTSGRTFVRIRLELIQGAHAEKLAELVVPKNKWASIDPRTQRAALTATLTPELLARFEAGPALLRATALGGSQWLRVPLPEVRDLAVEVRGTSRKIREAHERMQPNNGMHATPLQRASHQS